MDSVREVFRLKWRKELPNRLIGEALSISKSTVATYLSRAERGNITSLDQIDSLSDDELSKIIFPDKFIEKDPVVDFERIHIESKRKNMTLFLLWEEELEKNASLYSYSSFHRHYVAWLNKKEITMRQDHRGGEKGFIDYAGTTMPIINSQTGKASPVQIFVMSLGASHYTYIEATWTQKVWDFLSSHIRAFEYFGGVPEQLIPDNLKSAVTKSDRYEPTLNDSYFELSKYHGSVIIPARVRRPQDKSIVENAVLNVSRKILARLRDRQFFSLEDLNRALWDHLEKYNSRKLQGLNESRKSLFEKIEKDDLLPLPDKRYEVAEWKRVKANIDYHISFEKNYYSVPYKFRREEMKVRYSKSTVEVYHDHKRVAVHCRLIGERKSSTKNEHMPVGHRAYAEWSPSKILKSAEEIGPSCLEVCKKIFDEKKYPVLGYQSCLGVVNLKKKYTASRLEMACRRSIAIGGISYKSIQSILSKGLEGQPLEDPKSSEIKHSNIRGSSYYRSPKKRRKDALGTND